MAVEARIDAAIGARADLVDERHETAFRVLNGFREGVPGLVIDIFGRTAVLHDHDDMSDGGEPGRERISAACARLLDRLPFLQSIILKPRTAADPAERRGRFVYGETSDRRIRENGVWYALDLFLNQDASFYLDTRNLRAWATANLAGKSVLNTFAYTGSLGVAAMAAPARKVVNLDLNRAFLNVAKASYTLNGFPIRQKEFVSGDFFSRVTALKRSNELFDCVFVDPPFFSQTRYGTVDLVTEYHRILNKVRPLVADGGTLVAINNALFVPGADYVALLEGLCADGYMTIEEHVEMPDDTIGYPQTRVDDEIVSPAPFNGPTKIAVLRVRRKDGRKE
ncbi:MAG: class I SAM-dependent methyltransferase [Blastocatellia bacterium]|nr:class I SAM-dependent methyltransferase [Blastocatellia bacterium]